MKKQVRKKKRGGRRGGGEGDGWGRGGWERKGYGEEVIMKRGLTLEDGIKMKPGGEGESEKDDETRKM